MEELVSFPPCQDEPPTSQNFMNFYGKMRNAASSLYQTIQIPQDEPTASPSPSLTPVRSEQPQLTINTAHKSRPSVSITDDATILSSSEPITLTAGDHSDVESLFSTASYSLSKAYLANQYRQGRKRALNSLGREFWMKDENAKSCFRCLKAFTTFRRRHHCRVCGQIFCSGCTKLISKAKFQGSQRPGSARIRCCLNCLNTLSSLHSSSDEEELPSFMDESPTRTPRTPRSAMPDEFHFPRQRTPSISAEEPFMRSRSNTRSSGRSMPIASNYSALPAVPLPSSAPAAALPTPQPTRAIFPIKQESISLNDASLRHLSIFLERVLSDSELGFDEWFEVLKQALLHIADTVKLDIIGKERADPKDWVKLKRIPGGLPSDIECLSGTVFTHNFALKNMPRRVLDPRILLISFPLEYARGESRYMSLTPVLAQETEYLRKLVRRIEQLKPNVLLSSSHISGVALQLLSAAGIVVATGIREFALERLARYTNTEALSSLDRLSVMPVLGVCDCLELRTYRQENHAKSFLFFTGLPTTGCTVLLRGDENNTKLVKAVMEIMTDVTLSLQMETHLMRDQFVLIPETDSATAENVLSSSPFVHYRKPYLFDLSAQLEDEYVAASEQLKVLGESEQSDQGEHSEHEGHDMPEVKDLGLPLPFVLPANIPSPAETKLGIQRALAASNKISLYTKWTEAKQQWEQEESANPFMQNPCSHQTLNYSFFLYCNQTDASCVGPEMCSAEFYLASDIPLGQYVESVCNTFQDVCPDGCPNIMGNHRRCYFHGNGLITVRVKQEKCGIHGLQDTILMWNRCKLCDHSTAYVPMSAHTWRYSFGKYLELSFWGVPLGVRASNCRHNIYRDYVRCFGWHDMAIEIDYSPIELFEVDVPRLELRGAEERLINYKIKTWEMMQTRIKAFWRSLRDTLGKIQLEGLDDEKHAEATRRLEAMNAAAERDRRECLEFLDEVFCDLDVTDFLGLNSALRFAQTIVARYHAEFNNFDALFFPSEKDIRRVTVQQLKGLFEGDEDESGEQSSERGEGHQEQSGQSGRSERSEQSEQSEQGETDAEPCPVEPEELDPKDPGPGPIVPEEPPTILKSDLGTEININMTKLKQQLPPRSQKISFLAKHFEELSQEFELERQREQRRLLDRRQASIIADTQPVATVFKDVNEAVNDQYHHESEDADDEDESEDEAQQAPPPERKSLIQSLVDFWAERSSTRWSGIEYLLGPKEHLFSDSMVIIREDELSSLVAFCLSLPDYAERIASLYSEGTTFEEVLNTQKSVHLKYNFANGSTTMSCKTFFSQQFDALRKQCGCADTFIQSLSRCNPWENSGGKSGSLFLKTADNRFILKSISQSEFDSWSNFAPSYFNYMSQALFHELPTALAKIFGVYQIHIRTSTSNTRMYIVVSEDLFGGKQFTRFFDLKGSMRNRKAAETGKANEVLLDENMLDYIYENPVYVREHSKRRLRASLYNDTLFLTKMNVMDYSLVIGIDEDTNTIVSGIIDYIRAFTWDKKVESWVKGRAAGGAIEPTVISPKQYKVRFRESMEHYFLLVPDCWHLGAT